MLTLDQFDYTLPEDLIANVPAEPRDSSRLLVLDRNTQQIVHYSFSDLPKLLDKNTVIVRNNTKVIPARLLGQKTSGGQVEILLNKQLRIDGQKEQWEVLTKPGLKVGQIIIFEGSDLQATCIKIDGYTRVVDFNKSRTELLATFSQVGHTPIPPYIHFDETDEAHLREIYQTTFAKIAGSSAAPTAGLHFTREIDHQLQEQGIEIKEVTLHVGLGTFLPVKDNDISNHHMHSEFFEISKETAQYLNEAKQANKKILAVGTTSMRTLESAVNENGEIVPQSRETDIFITPPYKFAFVDHLITNFHLPKSTLLMLVSAFTTAPNTPHQFVNLLASPIGKAYIEAIKEKYRFFSFGDAMLIR